MLSKENEGFFITTCATEIINKKSHRTWFFRLILSASCLKNYFIKVSHQELCTSYTLSSKINACFSESIGVFKVSRRVIFFFVPAGFLLTEKKKKKHKLPINIKFKTREGKMFAFWKHNFQDWHDFFLQQKEKCCLLRGSFAFQELHRTIISFPYISIPEGFHSWIYAIVFLKQDLKRQCSQLFQWILS